VSVCGISRWVGLFYFPKLFENPPFVTESFPPSPSGLPGAGGAGDDLRKHQRYLMSELEAAAAVEATAMDVDLDEDITSGARCGEHAGDDADGRSRESTSADKENNDENPTACGARVPPFQNHSYPSICSPGPPRQYPLTFSSSPRAGPQQPASPSEELDKELVAARARAMFLGGAGHPRRSGERPIATEATYDLVFLAKTVVLELFEQRRSEVRMVSETARLDQEEAVAYLLGDLLDYELLPEEARPIGKASQHAAAVYRGKPKGGKGKPSADQRLKDKASTDRSKARAAAAKSEALAASLDARLEAIDEQLAADRRELACTVVPLPWPDRRSVIRAVPVPKPPRKEEATEKAAATVAEAEAAKVAADAEVKRATRALARLKPRPKFDGTVPEFPPLYFFALDCEPEEQARRDALRAELGAAERALLYAKAAAQDAAWEEKAAQEELEWAECDRRRAEQFERETQEREARWAAERAAWQKERGAEAAEGEARRAELEARRAELEARLAALDRARALEPVRWEIPTETRARLHGGAEVVWGSVEDRVAATPPKVFKLTGMSAAEVQGLASEVSQECTGTEERVALNRSGLS
jgi:hypothetical protein